MKISERKRRLRTRGIVPVSQAPGTPRRSTSSRNSNHRGATGTSNKDTTTRPAQRSRWQFSPTQQIIFGAVYIIFSPIMFLQYLSLANDPKVKAHPGAIEFALPVIFFLFGLWFIYRGIQGRRQRSNKVVSD